MPEGPEFALSSVQVQIVSCRSCHCSLGLFEGGVFGSRGFLPIVAFFAVISFRDELSY
mgnify:CR=1 FL=1